MKTIITHIAVEASDDIRCVVSQDGQEPLLMIGGLMVSLSNPSMVARLAEAVAQMSAHCTESSE